MFRRSLSIRCTDPNCKQRTSASHVCGKSAGTGRNSRDCAGLYGRDLVRQSLAPLPRSKRARETRNFFTDWVRHLRRDLGRLRELKRCEETSDRLVRVTHLQCQCPNSRRLGNRAGGAWFGHSIQFPSRPDARAVFGTARRSVRPALQSTVGDGTETPVPTPTWQRTSSGDRSADCVARVTKESQYNHER